MAIDIVPIITGLSAGATIGTGWLIRELRHRRNNRNNSNGGNGKTQTQKEVDQLEKDVNEMKGDIREIKTTQKLFMRFTKTQFNLILRLLNGKK